MNHVSKFTCLLLIAVLALPLGCPRRPTYGPSTTSITANVGAEFVLELPSNQTTGYRWELTKALDRKVVEFVSYTYEPSKSGRIGAGGTELWTFRATGKGRTRIQLEYQRPWEKKRPALQTYTVTIIVS